MKFKFLKIFLFSLMIKIIKSIRTTCIAKSVVGPIVGIGSTFIKMIGSFSAPDHIWADYNNNNNIILLYKSAGEQHLYTYLISFFAYAFGCHSCIIHCTLAPAHTKNHSSLMEFKTQFSIKYSHIPTGIDAIPNVFERWGCVHHFLSLFGGC